MPVETFGYPDSLNASYPPTSDGLVGGDDHIRGIKSTIKNTFPNISGAITATHTDLNAAVVAVVTDGVAKLDDDGVFFKTSGDGFKNSLAGDIDVWLGGQIGATFQRTGGANFFKITGQVEATTLKGGGMVPIGGVLIWPSNSLPPSTEGTFAWCNGATYSKTTYATCFERIGGSVSETLFAVPNYQEVTLVGRSGMGGATAPGLLTSIAAGVKDLLGALFGSDLVALTADKIPTITSTVGVSGTLNGSTSAAATGSNGTTTPGGAFPCIQNLGLSALSCTVSGSMSGSATSNNTGGTTPAGHSNVQPSRVTNYIIRLA